MKKYVRQSLDFLLFSNIFIALCAAAQALVTYQLLQAKADKHVLGLLFFSTLALYNFSILLAKPQNPGRSPFRRIRWIFAHHRLMISITIIAILSLIPLILFLSTPAKILLIFLGLVSVAYNLPLFTINNKAFGLRNIPGIKLFLIALVFSLSCVLIPVLELESHQTVAVSTRDTILLIAKRFLFIAAITIPFDIRDLFQDRIYELKTIPVLFGEKNSYFFCQLLLIIYLVMLFMFTDNFDANFIGLMLTILLTAWLIFRSRIDKNEYYYFLYLDGTMILQFIMLWLVNWVKF